MTTINLTIEQLCSSAENSGIPQNPLSAFSTLMGKVDVGRVINSQVAKSDGSIKKSFLPVLEILSNPATITQFAFLRPDSFLDAAVYSPQQTHSLPTVSMIARGDEIELKFPAQIEELVSAFHEGLMPYTEDTINLDIELPLDQAWIIWALIDQVRFHGNEVLQPLSLEGLVKMMEFPMISLFSLAGYYRDSLDLAQMTISGIKKACTALVKRKLITTENDGYLPGKKIQTIAKGLIQICSHLRLLNKVLKEGTVYELKYWCIQSQDGLCVLWNEVDGIVQMRTLTIGKVILLIQQLVLQAVEYYQ